MILLKKPYKPLMYTGLSASYNVYGKSFMRLQAVYLSGAPVPNTTFYNPFSSVPKLSAAYPGFTGYKLLSTEYSTNFDNTITIKIPPPIQAGYIDIIAQNPAGYGKLTQYVVKEPYSGVLPLSALRPWSLGVKVLSGVEEPPLPDNLLYTIAGDILVTIQESNFIVSISEQPPAPEETYYFITNNGDILITNANDKLIYGT
jgi:hypothetical protein